MNRQKKPFKFYIIIFAFSMLMVAAYSLYAIYVQDREVADIYTIWFMPLIFTAFYYGSDVLIYRLTNRKKKENFEGKFLNDISKKMRDSNEFIVEEFRRLQNNVKFQEDLNRAYKIFKEGENEVLTIAKLERKYRKGTLEKRAMKYVTDYLIENKKNQETN
ncbi:hypothetical protein ACAG96_05745 [Candidatus Izemoplasma sp. B36]|uniref:hypothetical protein n=1 Tax=Candidatus Izemoplasma sp. B36 TaxID=3242468 RepID=UPI003557BFC3